MGGPATGGAHRICLNSRRWQPSTVSADTIPACPSGIAGKSSSTPALYHSCHYPLRHQEHPISCYHADGLGHLLTEWEVSCHLLVTDIVRVPGSSGYMLVAWMSMDQHPLCEVLFTSTIRHTSMASVDMPVHRSPPVLGPSTNRGPATSSW